MEGIFSNREISILFWVLILLFFSCTKRDIRGSLVNLISAFFNRHIVTLFLLMAGYVYLVVDTLFSLGLWEFGQLKNTIMWFVLVASVELLKANRIKNEYFKNSIKGHFKLLVILEFIVAFQSFSLISELIIVPVLTLVALLLAVSETKDEYKPAKKVFSFLQSIFGLAMVSFGIYFIVKNFSGFSTLDTIFDFVTPLILSVFLLPFIYVVSVYMRYEVAVSRVNTYTEDKFLRPYAKIQGLFKFKADNKKLRRWLNFSCASDFKSRSSIKESIVRFNSEDDTSHM